MTTTLRITLMANAVGAALFGLILLLVPGRSLDWLGWAPIDPLISRLFGAALLGMAWASYSVWKANDRGRAQVVIEMEAIFTILGSIALLRHLLFGNWPWYAWSLLAILALMAVAWIAALARK